MRRVEFTLMESAAKDTLQHARDLWKRHHARGSPRFQDSCSAFLNAIQLPETVRRFGTLRFEACPRERDAHRYAVGHHPNEYLFFGIAQIDTEHHQALFRAVTHVLGHKCRNSFAHKYFSTVGVYNQTLTVVYSHRARSVPVTLNPKHERKQMSHNLDMSNNRANIAFLGSRNDVWHRMGQEMLAGQTIDQWAAAAGLGWSAVKVPAVVALNGNAWDHIPAEKRFLPAPDRSFIVRSDNAGLLGYVSGETDASGYQIVQPAEVLDWFQRYIAVDDRFELDVCGSLDGGRRIWATAKYNGDVNVGGESHAMRVLMSTTYDASGATINQCTATRTVCQNTLRIAHADGRAQIKTRHSTRFDAAKVGKELAQLASGFAQFKAIGDAMAGVEMSATQISEFFKTILEIPFDAKRDDISARKSNQFSDLTKAYSTSVKEGAEKNSVWAALQAVTRYADHDRSVQKGAQLETVARFNSAQFGTGDQLKGKAMTLLLPMVKDRVLVAA
jgi:phage/plasmid-like protein (TIGR03299 family)